MAVAGLLVPEEKSCCSQVPAIEMQVRSEGGMVTGLQKKMLMV